MKQFNYHGRVFGEDEITEFETELRKAIDTYYYDTGRRATHLVLGRREHVSFHAMIQIRQLMTGWTTLK